MAQLTFAPVQGHLLVLDERAPSITAQATPRVVTKTVQAREAYGIKRASPNALTLDTCCYRKGQGDWSEELPVIAIQEILEDEGYQGPVTLRFAFQTAIKPESIQVVIEDAQEYAIQINGQPVAYAGLPYYVDRSFLPVDITEHVAIGENILDLTRDFEPTAKAAFSLGSLFQTHTGVELESIYLIGDFAVKGAISHAQWRPRCVRFAPGFALAGEGDRTHGDLIAAGYPFFAGRLSLITQADLELPKEGERVLLSLPNLELPLAKVWVNGQEAGAILWPPYQVDITPLVRQGANAIEIEFVTSLRNLLGPHHRIDGERDDVWGNPHYSARYESGKDWYKRRGEPGIEWTDDYFCLEFGLKGPLTIEYVSGGTLA